MTGTLIELATSNRSYYVPGFELRVRGAPMPRNVVRDISEVTYEDSVERVDSFTLTVANWDSLRRQPKYIGLPRDRAGEANARIFEPGNELQLRIGYDGKPVLMMTGFITTLDVEFSDQSVPKMTVHGLNVIDRLRIRQYTWSWPDDSATSIRDSDVAKALEGPPGDDRGRPGLGIPVRIDAAARGREVPQPHIFMNNQYPIVFLLERARRLGYEISIDEEAAAGQASPRRVLFFGPSTQRPDVTYVLEWGKSLQSFRPLYSSAGQLYSVRVCGWNRRTKERIEERVTLDEIAPAELPNPDLVAVARAANREDVVTDEPVSSAADARRLAISRLCGQQHEMVTASCATVGLPDLRAGRKVMIRGTGLPFDGVYFITATRHVIGESGYRTSFEAKRIGPEPGR
ncbi:phage late control D family protein [Roseomonas marmotae]|uniref:Phage late control D family protein n=1 Tax=Roseomonas marmotae TaxID=2768161 RepID=A0ABS3KFD0_9PROT|nr:phage late control D family protein [Roseomonas marmotae]MBO1076179.1 phage late control D family protein [Roseomonas marmotae]